MTSRVSVEKCGLSLFRQNFPYICCCPCACIDSLSPPHLILSYCRRIPWLCLCSHYCSAAVSSRPECSRTPCSICSSCRTNHCNRSCSATAAGHEDSVKHRVARSATRLIGQGLCNRIS